MADYHIQWVLNQGTSNEVTLPIISDEIGQDLIDTRGFSEFSCPNSFVTRKGKEGAECYICITRADISKLNSDGTNTLTIIWTALSDTGKEELPTATKTFKNLYLVDLYEVNLYKTLHRDHDLLVAELSDIRYHLLKTSKFKKYELTQEADNPPSSSLSIPEIIWSEDLSNIYNGKTLNTTSFSFPESGEGETQFFNDVYINSYDAFIQTLDRTENVFFIDEDGNPVAQKFNEYSQSVYDTILAARPNSSSSKSYGEDLDSKGFQLWDTLVCNFWTSTSRVDHTQESIALDPSNDGAITNTELHIFPLTDPNSEPNYAAITAEYRDIIKEYQEREDEEWLLSGFLDVPLASQVSVLGYTNNPFQVTTFVRVLSRHGIPHWEFMDQAARAGLGVIRGYTNSAVTDTDATFQITVTESHPQSVDEGEIVTVVNPLDHTNSSKRGYTLDQNTYITAVQWLDDQYLIIDAPCAVDYDSTLHAPTDITLSNNQVDADSPGVTIGTLSTTDADLPNDTHTYEIVGDDQGLEIDGNTLSVQDDGSGLDIADDPITVNISSTDAGGRGLQMPFQIGINAPADDGTAGRFALTLVQPQGISTSASLANTDFAGPPDSIPNNYTWTVPGADTLDDGDSVQLTLKNTFLAGTSPADDLTITNITVTRDLLDPATVTATPITITPGNTTNISADVDTTFLVNGTFYKATFTITHSGDAFGMPSPFVFTIDQKVIF